MALHSHWATIKRKKAVTDQKKGKAFSRCARQIIVAARAGGGDPRANLSLQYAIEEARKANMPRENIERAIKRGTGELDGGNLDGVVYEGYGPGGTAFWVDALTDNRNRTASEVRKVFDTHGGSVATPGAVAWLFDKKGLIAVRKDKITEEKLYEIALDAGAEDVQTSEELFHVTTAPQDFDAVRKAIIHVAPTETAELAMIPKAEVPLDAATAQRAASLYEAIDDLDDVQSISVNFQLPG